MNEIIDFGKAARGSGVVETPTFKKIQNMLRYCHGNRWMGLLRGGFGVGKTFAIEQYRESSPRDVAIVTLDPTTGSMTGGLTALREAVGVLWDEAFPGRFRASGYSMQSVQMRGIYRFCQDLADADRPLLLVIDEAQFARPDLLETFRSIHDHGPAGLVISGNEKLFNPRAGRMVEADFGAVMSRARLRYELPAPTPGDIAAVLDYFKIAGKDSRELLAARAAWGGLRQVVAVIDLARQRAGAPIVNFAQLTAAAAAAGSADGGWTRISR
jgi:hypothetical protein